MEEIKYDTLFIGFVSMVSFHNFVKSILLYCSGRDKKQHLMLHIFFLKFLIKTIMKKESKKKFKKGTTVRLIFMTSNCPNNH
ncbi:hypothetical protein GLOIN_2v1574094 [Rhizophagus irregularis DAOM 181602=DAOM 197198]|nr:hypothetical protein GLOIN_2v1574094 [Rhizophagus irregularis DAOM 181602=DAOM 197198]